MVILLEGPPIITPGVKRRGLKEEIFLSAGRWLGVFLVQRDPGPGPIGDFQKRGNSPGL